MRVKPFLFLSALALCTCIFSCGINDNEDLPDINHSFIQGNGLAEIFSKEDFTALFPDSVFVEQGQYWTRIRNPFYTYEAFLEAASRFPKFCNEGNITLRKRELAAFLANTSHETTGGYPNAPNGPYSWGYYFIREVGCFNERTQMEQCPGYVDTSGVLGKRYRPAAGQQYYGRGPIQLSYNFNYGYFSDQIGMGDRLLREPDLLARDSVLSYMSAIWFWMTPQGNKPSCHNALIGRWEPTPADRKANRVPGFGITIDIINGGIECGYGANNEASNRIGFYQRFTEYFNIGKGDFCDCERMKPF
ncbi:MAG: chitinase [Cytophagales bacterium]|nr:chitinase [Cytophagales bacterium]